MLVCSVLEPSAESRLVRALGRVDPESGSSDAAAHLTDARREYHDGWYGCLVDGGTTRERCPMHTGAYPTGDVPSMLRDREDEEGV